MTLTCTLAVYDFQWNMYIHTHIYMQALLLMLLKIHFLKTPLLHLKILLKRKYFLFL